MDLGNIRLLWWNLDRFFDAIDDPISIQLGHSTADGWTQASYEAKRDNLARAIRASHSNSGPELVAFAEIESELVLTDLLVAAGLSHFEILSDPVGPPKSLGLGVAVAYDPRKLRIATDVNGADLVASHVVHLRFPTRDIVEVVFEIVESGDRFVFMATHWPSRKLGRDRTEPLRIAVAENLAYLIRRHALLLPDSYEAARRVGAIERVLDRWNTPVIVVGDFNDEPYDRSVARHLQAARTLERVLGDTNTIADFDDSVSTYRNRDLFVYNPCWRFLNVEHCGTYFYDGRAEPVTHRFELLDQLVVSRGMLMSDGPKLALETLTVPNDSTVATRPPYCRPRSFDRSTGKGTSDHLPLAAVIEY